MTTALLTGLLALWGLGTLLAVSLCVVAARADRSESRVLRLVR